MIAMRERHMCLCGATAPPTHTRLPFWSTSNGLAKRSASGRAGADPLPGTIVHTQLNRTRDCPVALAFTPHRALQPGSLDSPPERSRDPHSPSWGSQVPPRRGSQETRRSPRAKCAQASPAPHTEGGDRANREGGGGDVRSRTKGRDGASASRTSPLLHPCQPSLALGASAHLLPHEPLTDTELRATHQG